MSKGAAREMIERFKVHALRHKLMTIITLVVMVIFVDSISHFLDPQKSWYTRLTVGVYDKNIDRALMYLEGVEQLDTDEALIAMRLGAHVRAEQIMLPGDPFFRMNDLQFGPRQVVVSQDVRGTKELSEEVKRFITDPTDDVLYKAFYCDRGIYGVEDLAEIINLQDYQAGYGDTHALLALRIIDELGCWSKDLVEEESLVTRLYEAQDSAPVDDLYFERVVFLYWAGAGEEVKKEWITKILKSQNDDGGFPAIVGGTSDPHATVLAALALRFFDQGKKQQSVIMDA